MELQHFDVIEETFESPVLRGNPAGDPHRRIVPVVVPKGGRASGGGGFPVAFVLAGFSGCGQTFLGWRGWQPTLPERLDRLRAQGKIGDLIAVLPDGFTRYGGSQYINSAANGRYEDMIVQDLVAWVDSRFPTLPHARHRAILGKSSGGYGSLVLGMRHPDVFGAVACHSGDMYFEYCYRNDFPRLLRQIDKYGGVGGFLKAFDEAPKKTSDMVLAMNVFAMAAAYSPDPSRPGAVQLPFDPATGIVLEDVWRSWKRHDPVELCAAHAENLRKLRLLFLDCGRFDQYHLQYGLRILARRLSELGVPHVVEEFDDDHSDTSYRYDVSFPKIWEAVR